MLNYIVKISYPYLILTPVLVVFAYSSQKGFGGFYPEMLSTLVMSYLFYFGILTALRLILRSRNQIINKTIFVSISTLVYLFISSVIICNYVGKINWGTPINYKLYFEIFSSFKSTILTLFTSSTSYLPFLIGLFSVIGLVAFHIKSFVYSKNLSDLLLVKKSKSSILIIGMSILSVVFCVIHSSTGWGTMKDEIFVSFCTDLDPLQRSKSMRIGVEALNRKVSKIENFEKKNVIIFSVDCLRSDHLSYLGYHREIYSFASL